MSKATHQVFKRIVLHNKLLSEPDVDALLAEFDDPEHAVQRLVERHLLTAKAAEQFLAVYKKQVDRLFLDELGALDEPAAKPATPPEPASPAHAVKKEPKPEVKVKAETAASKETKPLPEAGIKLVYQLLGEARDMGASDLHLKSGMAPTVRFTAACKNCRIHRWLRTPARPPCWPSWTISSGRSSTRITIWTSAMTAANWDASARTTWSNIAAWTAFSA